MSAAAGAMQAPGVAPAQQQQQQQQAAAMQAAAAAAQQQQQQQQRKLQQLQAEAAAANKRLAPGVTAAASAAAGKRKAADRHLPDKVAHVVPESVLFNRLLADQRKIDDLTARRRADVRESLSPAEALVKKVLRVTVSSTHTHQAHGSGQHGGGDAEGDEGDGPLSDPPSWVLVIHGRLIDPPGGQGAAAAPAAAGAPLQAQDPHAVAAALGLPVATVISLGLAGMAGVGAATGTQPANPAPTPSLPRHPFTYYLRRVTVRLGSAALATNPQHDGQGKGAAADATAAGAGKAAGSQGQVGGGPDVVVWDRTAHVGPHRDSLEIRRTGSDDVPVVVEVELDWQPDRYVLEEPLAEALGFGIATKARTLQAVWAYIKARRLQDPRAPHNVILDPALAQAFGCASFKLSQVGERLAALLKPMPPAVLRYIIRPSQASSSPPEVYDLEVELAPPAAPGAGAGPGGDGGRLLGSLQLDALARDKDKEVEVLDHELNRALRALADARRRRTFYIGFSQAPVDFVRSLMASQARDLRVAKQGGRELELERSSDVFRQPWVEDAAVKFLHKRMAAGRT